MNKSHLSIVSATALVTSTTDFVDILIGIYGSR